MIQIWERMIYILHYLGDVKYVLYLVQIWFQTSYVSVDTSKRSQHVKRILSENAFYSVSVKNWCNDDKW
jgi:hypothetical protein